MNHPAPGRPIPATAARVADMAEEIESATTRHMRVACQVAAFVAAPLRDFDRYERAAILRIAGNLLDITSGHQKPARTKSQEGRDNG